MEQHADMYNAMQIETKTCEPTPVPFSQAVGWAGNASVELLNGIMGIYTSQAHRLAKRAEYKKLLGTIMAEPMVAGWRSLKWITKFTTDKYVLRLGIDFGKRAEKALNYNPYSTDWEMHVAHITDLLIIRAEPDAASVYEARLNEAVRKMILSDQHELFPSLEIVDMCPNNNHSLQGGGVADLLHYSE